MCLHVEAFCPQVCTSCATLLKANPDFSITLLRVDQSIFSHTIHSESTIDLLSCGGRDMGVHIGSSKRDQTAPLVM